MANGTVDPSADLTAPFAAYRFADLAPYGGRDERLILAQHGSYHIGDIQSQPGIDRDEAIRFAHR